MSIHPAHVLGFAIACLALGSGCTFTIDEVDGVGIGEKCSLDADCHAGACEVGLCTAPCSSNADCPTPSACFADRCELPLRATALWEGVVTGGEGWNLTHQQGMQYAASKLPYLVWNYEEAISTLEPDLISDAVDRHVEAGAQVIVANSFSQEAELLKKASQYPEIHFLVGGGAASNAANYVSFYAYYEQAWFTAGKLAALKAKKRLGMIVDLVTPEQVREVNAFTLGARSVNPELVVEVAWIGFWLDYNTLPTYELAGQKLYREELLAARLIASGCEVIAHNSDNQRAVRYIESETVAGRVDGVWSIADNNRDGYRALTVDGPTGAPMATCLGSAYYNFGAQQTRLLRSVHDGTFHGSPTIMDPMTSDPESSPIGFQLNPTVGIDDIAARTILKDVTARGPEGVFEGPYEINGQRDRDDDGQPDADQTMAPAEILGLDEYFRACWFVKGAIEKSDPLDPTSADVDALVPDGDVPPPPDILGPPGAPPGAGVRCHENL